MRKSTTDRYTLLDFLRCILKHHGGRLIKSTNNINGAQ